MSYPLTSFGFKPRFLTETLSLFGYQVSQLWSVIIPNKPGSETHYNPMNHHVYSFLNYLQICLINIVETRQEPIIDCSIPENHVNLVFSAAHWCF